MNEEHAPTPVMYPADATYDDASIRALRLALLAAGLAVPLALLARYSTPDPTGIPLISTDGRWFYLLALVATAGVGVAGHVTDFDAGYARASAVRLGYTWIADQGRLTSGFLPALTMAAAMLIVGTYHSWPMVVVTPLLAGSGVYAGALARHFAFAPDPPTRRSGRMAFAALTLIVGFVVLALVYHFRMRSIVSGPAVWVATGSLVMVATDGVDLRLRQRIAFAVVCGGILAEATWALNYWNLPGWYGGIMLAALAGAAAAAIVAHAEERLNRSAVLRYSALVSLITIVVAFVADQPG